MSETEINETLFCQTSCELFLFHQTSPIGTYPLVYAFKPNISGKIMTDLVVLNLKKIAESARK
jgi:hypothetical protein